MAEHFESLVDLWEKSCTKYAGRQLFGTKTGGGWTWITYAQFRASAARHASTSSRNCTYVIQVQPPPVHVGDEHRDARRRLC